MAQGAELAISGTPQDPSRILLAECTVSRPQYDALLAQTAANADGGGQVISVLSRDDHGGLSFTGTEVLPAARPKDLPRIAGNLCLVNELAPEVGDEQPLAGVSRRPAVVEASAIGGLRRAIRRNGDEVRLSFWGSSEQPGTYVEQPLPRTVRRARSLAS